MKPLTPADLVNPNAKSGYRHVRMMGFGPFPNGHSAKGNPFAAESRKGKRWCGPRRATPLEAAQDYCNYVNGSPVTRQTPNLQRSNHRTQRPKHTKGVRNKLRKRDLRRMRRRRDLTPGFVYLIGIKGDVSAVKVGWSVAPGFARLPELQTGNPHLLVGIAEFAGTLDAERLLHCRYEADNILNEWFIPTPELLTEFDLTPGAFVARVSF
jgi:hypothetical protein